MLLQNNGKITRDHPGAAGGPRFVARNHLLPQRLQRPQKELT